jgi:hypothetical protein
LSSRFARVRARAAHRDLPRDEQWLIIEWAEGANEPAHYWFSNLPRRTAWQDRVVLEGDAPMTRDNSKMH